MCVGGSVCSPPSFLSSTFHSFFFFPPTLSPSLLNNITHDFQLMNRLKSAVYWCPLVTSVTSLRLAKESCLIPFQKEDQLNNLMSPLQNSYRPTNLKRKNWKKTLKSCGCHYRLVFPNSDFKVIAAEICSCPQTFMWHLLCIGSCTEQWNMGDK